MSTVTVAGLKKVIALSDLPDEHLQWVIDHSEYHAYEDGTQIKKTGDDADVMIMILEGKISFYLDHNGKLVFYLHFENDTATGGVSGLMPYSRMKRYPGCSFAEGNLRTLQLHKQYFAELEHLNPDFIQRLIGYMTERAKLVATTQLQHEKVNALGQLSAGIAHELNNPASAIDRIASELIKRLGRNYELTENLLQCNISAEALQVLRSIDQLKLTEEKIKMSALQRMEEEDEITGWLNDAGIISAHNLAETFVDEGYGIPDLENIKEKVSNEAFEQFANWLENILSSKRIIKDLEEASGRISYLVGAIKSHVHMDRTNDLQPTDIHKDIENTLTLLGYKLREKNITIIKNFNAALPEIPVYAGELNQVWTNIIDNAIHAVSKNGVITVSTSFDDKNIEVKITDNGAGIPHDIISRIFDPFFTTKKMGEGTGIGLDLVNRIVKHHDGQVSVRSEPGNTTFTICIPLIPPRSN